MSFSITSSGTDRLLVRLGALAPDAQIRLDVAIASETEAVRSAALDRMASLFRNAGGRMRNALSTNVVRDGDVVTGEVIASGLPYLGIQEYGGTTRPHDIYPVNALALAFASPGAAQFHSGSTAATVMVFARHVAHPGSRMPERSFLRAALATRRSAIREALTAAVYGAVSAGVD